jgi:hypothetical protein
LLDQHCLALQDLILVGQQHRRTQRLNESKVLELLGKPKNTEGVTFHAGISR